MARQSLPETIQREHIQQAAEGLDAGVDHEFAESTKYDVLINGKRYAPKAIVGVAARHAEGLNLGPKHFSGGLGSKCFRILEDLGFRIVVKPEMELHPTRTWLLTWKPTTWEWTSYEETVESVQNNIQFEDRWSCGNTKSIQPGDRIFLLRQGSDKPGLVGTGVATSCFVDFHWNESGKQTRYAGFTWESLVDVDGVLPRQTLLAELPDVNWNTQSSGIEIHRSGELLSFWHRHIGKSTQPADDQATDFEIEDFTSKIKVRRKQSVFRRRVLENFAGRCCVTGVEEPSLLVASHIVPWAAAKEHRLDPANGLCLFGMIDQLFDSGFISFDDELKVLVSKTSDPYLKSMFVELEGQQATKPIHTEIKTAFLAFTERTFSGS